MLPLPLCSGNSTEGWVVAVVFTPSCQGQCLGLERTVRVEVFDLRNAGARADDGLDRAVRIDSSLSMCTERYPCVCPAVPRACAHAAPRVCAWYVK